MIETRVESVATFAGTCIEHDLQRNLAIRYQALLDLGQELLAALVSHDQRLRLRPTADDVPVLKIQVDSPDVFTTQASAAQARFADPAGYPDARSRCSGSFMAAVMSIYQRLENA